ncbi:MAG: hypothetical protein VKL39_17505 [Leptolyngbyaceae bacterium]|nr:hypothetical protein [Leptolyngbyaceae bacterium]
MSLMNVSDATIIQAFTVTLPRLEMVLSPEMKQAAHQVGDALAHHHPEEAAEQIQDLVQHHRCLASPFQVLYRDFQSRVQLNSEESEVSSESLEMMIEGMTVPILRSDDFVLSARQMIRQTLNQHQQDKLLPDIVHFFITCLQRAIATSDEQVTTILRALEQQLLSVEDIAHLLKIPVDQARQMVANLWERGYIDSAKSSVVGRAVAAFIRSPRPMPPENPTTHFVLTSRGHFHLHPLLIAKREDRLE